MKHMNLAAQAIGILGIAFSLLSFQLKKRKNILMFQMIASLLFSAQLFMVGAITGGCLDLISFIRTLVFFNNKKWAASKVWLYFFISVMIFTGILTWQDGWSILPMIGACLSTTALWMKQEKHIRLISLFVVASISYNPQKMADTASVCHFCRRKYVANTSSAVVHRYLLFRTASTCSG